MTMTSTPSTGPLTSAVRIVEGMVPPDVISLIGRISIAAIFFLSGRTKVEGVLTITEGTFFLFREEYRVPLLPPEMAAVVATGAEHLFPVLLVLGLATRFSALALLGMTLVIGVFVYPLGWPTHLLWAAVLLYLLRFGGGRFSLDHLLKWP